MKNLISLYYLKENEEGTVVDIYDENDITVMLLNMGIKKGDSIKVLQNSFNGQLIVMVKDTKLAIGQGISDKIIVEKKES
ncbi:MAG: ferrous iron transport protein A [bacterium]|nr:ferrous iron transport protein A [bacterium]